MTDQNEDVADAITRLLHAGKITEADVERIDQTLADLGKGYPLTLNIDFYQAMELFAILDFIVDDGRIVLGAIATEEFFESVQAWRDRFDALTDDNAPSGEAVDAALNALGIPGLEL